MEHTHVSKVAHPMSLKYHTMESKVYNISHPLVSSNQTLILLSDKGGSFCGALSTSQANEASLWKPIPFDSLVENTDQKKLSESATLRERPVESLIKN